jgi:hypothetical protein
MNSPRTDQPQNPLNGSASKLRALQRTIQLGLWIALAVSGLGAVLLYLYPPFELCFADDAAEFLKHASLHVAAVAGEILLAVFLVEKILARAEEAERRRTSEKLRATAAELLRAPVAEFLITVREDLVLALGDREFTILKSTRLERSPVDQIICDKVSTVYGDNRPGDFGYDTWLAETEERLADSVALLVALNPEVLATSVFARNSIRSFRHLTKVVVDSADRRRMICEMFIDIYLDLLALWDGLERTNEPGPVS